MNVVRRSIAQASCLALPPLSATRSMSSSSVCHCSAITNAVAAVRAVDASSLLQDLTVPYEAHVRTALRLSRVDRSAEWLGAGGQEISSNSQRGPLAAASLASQVMTGAASSSATAT